MEQQIIGFFFCAVPALMALALGVLLVWLLRPKGPERAAERMVELETAVHWLGHQNQILHQRLLQLEAQRAETPPVGAQVAPAEVAPPPMGAVPPLEAATAASSAAPLELAARGDALPPEQVRGELTAGAAGAVAGWGPGAGIEAPIERPIESAVESPIESPAGAAIDSSPASAGESGPVGGPSPVELGPSTAPPGPRQPPPTAPPPAAKPAPGIAWEQWIGVRGAAALGASILLLAGIYFFEYSIEHGLITPAMRMVAGTLVGLGCVLVSELRLRRTHPILGNWLSGAGVGILYVAFWAGRVVYDLYPQWVALILLVATTAACVALALRHGSFAVAALGLFGGFITPIALSTGEDNPVALFGYLLLLDGAMLWVAHRKRWPWMALACLGATSLYQVGWVFARLDEPRLLIGVAVIGVFALLFAALPSARPREGAPGEGDPGEGMVWPLARASGVMLPFFFTAGLAARSSLGESFWATAALLVLLSIAASLVGLRHRSPWLPSAAGLSVSGTLLIYAVAHEARGLWDVWLLVGLALVILVVFVLAAELGRWRGRPSAQIPAALFAASVVTLVCLSAPLLPAAGPWPWLLAWVAILAAGVVLGRHAGWERLPIAYAVLVGLGLGATFAAQVGQPEQPGGAVYLGLVLGVAVLGASLGLFGAPAARAGRDHAGGALAVTLLALLGLLGEPAALPVWSYLAATLVLALVLLLVAARSASAGWMVGALLGTALAQGLWVARVEEVGPVELLGISATVLLLAFFPVIAPAALRDRPWAWRTAALAGPLSLLSLRFVYLEVIGPETIGLLPVLLAIVSIGAATLSRARGPHAAEAKRVAVVWLLATAALFVTLAIPMQLENEWITIGWALEALALTALWRKLDHTGLKYLGLGLALAISVRLVANPYVLDYAGRGLPVLNWITYTYLVPAACLIGMWALYRVVEASRRRPWEAGILGTERPILAGLVASATVAVVFVWINLTILDVFTSEQTLRIPTERLPARDLSLSIAWAVYALCLLALGMLRRSTALRVASLALILITCGKAFLYDLAHLSDLYRVASLVGLALSLIVISIAYQRFVFRTAKSEAA